MSGKEVTINTTDGPFGGYLAAPASASGAGIVIIQEIFGINKFVRAVAERFAAHGYFALAPDLFWRIEPNVQLDDRNPAEFQRGLVPGMAVGRDQAEAKLLGLRKRQRGREQRHGRAGGKEAAT